MPSRPGYEAKESEQPRDLVGQLVGDAGHGLIDVEVGPAGLDLEACPLCLVARLHGLLGREHGGGALSRIDPHDTGNRRIRLLLYLEIDHARHGLHFKHGTENGPAHVSHDGADNGEGERKNRIQRFQRLLPVLVKILFSESIEYYSW